MLGLANLDDASDILNGASEKGSADDAFRDFGLAILVRIQLQQGRIDLLLQMWGEPRCKVGGLG